MVEARRTGAHADWREAAYFDNFTSIRHFHMESFFIDKRGVSPFLDI